MLMSTATAQRMNMASRMNTSNNRTSKHFTINPAAHPDHETSETIVHSRKLSRYRHFHLLSKEISIFPDFLKVIVEVLRLVATVVVAAHATAGLVF